MLTDSARTMMRIRTAARWSLIVACAAAALALGGVHKEAIVGSAILAMLALLLSSWHAQRFSVDALGCLLFALALFTALQLVPLPIEWLAALAPRTAATWRSAAEVLGHDPAGMAPLTLDPHSTGLMAVWWIAVAGAYMASRQLCKRAINATSIVLTVPAVACVVVGIGLVHSVIGADALFGFYEPLERTGPDQTGALYVSTFLNPNHLAAFLVLGLAIALGHAGNDQLTSQKRIVWVATFLLLCVGVVFTGSKAGILLAVFVVAAVLMGGQVGALRVAVILGVVAVALLALVTPLGEELMATGPLEALTGTVDSKTHLVGLEVVAEWPWTGVGRGSFPVAHTQVNEGHSLFIITHAHNTPIQVLADYGLIVGGLALGLGAFLLVPTLVGSMGAPLSRGISMGLVAVGIHNLIDFSMDILGVAISVATVAAILRLRAPGLSVKWWVVSALACLGIVVSVAGGLVLAPEPGPRRDAAIAASPLESLERYPADAYAALAAGIEERSKPILRHALRLHPSEAAIPLALAQLTEDDDRAFALVRTALGLPWAHRIQQQAFSLITLRARTGSEVLDALPRDGKIVAAYMKQLRPWHEPVIARALERFPDDPAVLEQVAAIRLTQGRLEEVDQLATQLMILGESDGYRYMGAVLLRKGRAYESYHMFLEAGDPESLLMAAQAAIKAGLPERALELLRTARVGPEQLKRLAALRALAEKGVAEQNQP